ncbi:MAG: tRNA preQ1(34) S-adenosylmethionine ribosyltransferase-isomerase QueA [Nitrospinae bacterium]|nr:tRNA preQ1(34) S-adenosylmethionine ribosyltransferase-isomerase QueA [Nitrospinota bacterium]
MNNKNPFFDYQLPEELIATQPLDERDTSRLMVVDRKKQTITDQCFKNIIDYLDAGDLLVLNNTKVIKAKLKGVREKNKKEVEVLFLNDLGDYQLSGLIKGASRLKPNEKILFPDGSTIVVDEKKDEEVIFNYRSLKKELFSWMESIGEMPVPPYIEKKRKESNQKEYDDPKRYQTVFAKEKGSVAAPTAGLHFTENILDDLRKKGVEIATVTLHVGFGTFKPIRGEDYTEHVMEPESYEMSQTVFKKIIETKKEGKRVVAVGSTATRTLETVFKDFCFSKNSGELLQDNQGKEGESTAPRIELSGKSSLYIYGEYDFKVVDSLITNFHFPKTTLLLLVSSFAGEDITGKAYDHAVKEKYRFFSYGDAMLIV